MKIHHLSTPLEKKSVSRLKVGDKVLLSGKILVARDQAHLKLIELIDKKKKLPVDLNGQVIYYAGPSPTKPGEIVGAIGPTTSIRMDKLAEPLFKQGVLMTIGKGERSSEFSKLVKKYKAPYLVAMGGGGALYYDTVLSSKCLAFPELGPEAIYELEVKQMPLYVKL